jgi:hypothetical protein
VDGALKNQEWVAPKLNTTADGSLYLSVLDLVAWDRGLRAGAVLKPGSWEDVNTPVRLNSGKTFPYGFGWDIEERAGEKVRRHGGAWQGFTSEIARFVGSDLTVVVLANLAEAAGRTGCRRRSQVSGRRRPSRRWIAPTWGTTASTPTT